MFLSEHLAIPSEEEIARRELKMPYPGTPEEEARWIIAKWDDRHALDLLIAVALAGRSKHP